MQGYSGAYIAPLQDMRVVMLLKGDQITYSVGHPSLFLQNKIHISEFTPEVADRKINFDRKQVIGIIYSQDQSQCLN